MGSSSDVFLLLLLSAQTSDVIGVVVECFAEIEIQQPHFRET